MRTALDTNILSSLISGEPRAAEIDLILKRCQQQGTLKICGAVYAELLAHPQASETFVNLFLVETAVEVDFLIDEDIWARAGVGYSQYAARRRAASGDGTRRIIADFVIGAHALMRADRLLTLDIRVYTQYFSDLNLHPGLDPKAEGPTPY